MKTWWPARRAEESQPCYALAGGEWMSYILGAPEFVNRAFFELFPEGLPAITPLVAKGPVPAAGVSARAQPDH